MFKVFKVRFHLAKGPHFMQWQIKSVDGSVEYYDPATVQLTLFNATLRNQSGTAQKIHDGANKTVCAWVECEELQVNWSPRTFSSVTDSREFSYNPRIAPYWRDTFGNNADSVKVEKLVSDNNRLYWE